MIYLWAYYTLHCEGVITSRHTRAATAEEDALGEQQAEVDAIGAQFCLTTHTGALRHVPIALRETEITEVYH